MSCCVSFNSHYRSDGARTTFKLFFEERGLANLHSVLEQIGTWCGYPKELVRIIWGSGNNVCYHWIPDDTDATIDFWTYLLPPPLHIFYCPSVNVFFSHLPVKDRDSYAKAYGVENN